MNYNKKSDDHGKSHDNHGRDRDDHGKDRNDHRRDRDDHRRDRDDHGRDHDDHGKGRGGRGGGRGGRGRRNRGQDGSHRKFNGTPELNKFQKECVDQCNQILEIINKKYCYKSSKKEEINLKHEMANCINLTFANRQFMDPGKKEFNPKQCEINLSSLSTIGCAREMHNKNFKRIAVMSFASAFKPGGFYDKGRTSQETSIISQTLLLGSLLSDSAKSFYFQREKRDDFSIFNNGIIFSPQVPVIADGETRLKEIQNSDGSSAKSKFILYDKKDIFYIDVISVSPISQIGLQKFNNMNGGSRDKQGRDGDGRQRNRGDGRQRRGDGRQRRGDDRQRRGDGRQQNDDDRKQQRGEDRRKGQNGDGRQRDHDHRGSHKTGDDRIKKSLERKIRSTIYVAISAGVDALVLGAFGCGKSANNPSLISSIFKKILIEEGYASYFKRIDFPLQESNIIKAFKKDLLPTKKELDSDSESDIRDDDDDVFDEEEEEEEVPDDDEKDYNKTDDDNDDYDDNNEKDGDNEDDDE